MTKAFTVFYILHKTYPVKSGDTISRIASKFDISTKEIQEWNEIEDVSKIFPGQVLKLFL